mgnify:CR=1 FL=1
MLTSLEDVVSFKKGDVLVADLTHLHGKPVISQASAIATHRGGKTCHAANFSHGFTITCVLL